MKNVELQDVTKEFLAKATPGIGNISYEEGFNYKYGEHEKLTALWLLETFGGEIILLKQNGGYMIKNPDYKWNGKFWELKNVKTSLSLDHAIRNAFKQISTKSGGIIIDISNYKEKETNVYGIINKRIISYAKQNGFIIIKKKNKLIKVYQY